MILIPIIALAVFSITAFNDAPKNVKKTSEEIRREFHVENGTASKGR